MNAHIRLVKSSDVESMVRVSLAARRYVYLKLLKGSAREKFINTHKYSIEKVAAFNRSLQKYIDTPDKYSAYIITSDTNKVAGYVKAVFSPDSVYISNLYVHPHIHGSGLGAALLDTIVQLAGTRVVCLDVVRDNQSAIAFYERRGFKEVSSTQRFIYSLPMIRMQKG